MLTIVSMNRAGLSDERLTFIVTFEFDNASTLPERAFNVGNMSYVLAKGSTAKNVVTGTNYEYTGSKWVKTSEITNSTSKTSTITDNGNYNVTNNDFVGFNDVTVDVSGEPPVLIKKSITENGEYTASSDNADGYLSVSVDVSGVGFNRLKSRVLLGATSSGISVAEVINSEDGEYEYTSSMYNTQYDTLSAFTPLKSFKYIMTHDYSSFYLAFTPASSFNPNTAFSILSTKAPPSGATIKGDTVTPGDGKAYFASLNMQSGVPFNSYSISITKTNLNWINDIT